MFACDWCAACGSAAGAGYSCHAAGGRSHFIARLLLAERQYDDNGVSKIAPFAALLTDRLLRFAMIVYSVAGYVHWYQAWSGCFIRCERRGSYRLRRRGR